MSFVVEDFHQLVALLEQHPEWRAELRRLVLSEQLLSLPDLVRELTEAQRRQAEEFAQYRQATEVRFQRIEEAIAQLTEAQRRTEEAVARLIEAQREIETALLRLSHQVEQLTNTVQALISWSNRITDDVGKLKQWSLEYLYASRAPAFFGKLVTRAHALTAEDLSQMLEDALEAGKITKEERDDLLVTDLVVRGRWHEDGEPVYLVIEISWGIGMDDTKRALRRARAFAKLGIRTVPVVAGERATENAIEEAHEFGIWRVMDGRIEPPRKRKPPIIPQSV